VKVHWADHTRVSDFHRQEVVVPENVTLPLAALIEKQTTSDIGKNRASLNTVHYVHYLLVLSSHSGAI